LTKAGCLDVTGQRLKRIVVFGSGARGKAGPDSDIDILIVAAGLPWGRLRRMEDFQIIEDGLQEGLAQLKTQGIATSPSVIFKTPRKPVPAAPYLWSWWKMPLFCMMTMVFSPTSSAGFGSA